MRDNGINPEIINIHTIKPLDVEAVIRSVSKTGCAVTAEEHMMNGGLGDSIAQVVVRNAPVPMEMVAVNDKFGFSAKPEELMTRFGLDSQHIVEAVLRVISRKKL